MAAVQDRVIDAAPQTASARAGDLVLKGMCKSFGDTEAVTQVDLTVAAGEFITLLGPSGCGKTTLLRMIAGFETPSAGQIQLGREDLTTFPPERRPLNMVFQRYALFPHLDVFDNVAYGLRNQGVRGEALTRRVDAALEMVDLAHLRRRSVRQLSGGQSQRVALARALVNEPRVLLLDEPLAALDLQLRKRMQVELRALQQRLGMTFVYVTHDQEEALAMSHRVAVMNRGHLAQVGTPEEVYHRPATRFVAEFIGEATLLVGEVVEPPADARLGAVTVRLAESGAVVRAVGDRDELHPGKRVALALRPEDLSIVAGTGGRLRGRLEDVVFLGGQYRHRVRLRDGAVVKVDLRRREAAVGEEIGVDWSDGTGVVVQEDA